MGLGSAMIPSLRVSLWGKLTDRIGEVIRFSDTWVFMTFRQMRKTGETVLTFSALQAQCGLPCPQLNCFPGLLLWSSMCILPSESGLVRKTELTP